MAADPRESNLLTCSNPRSHPFFTQAFATEWLVLPADADVSVKSLSLQRQNSASRDGVQMRIDGGKLTTSATSYMGNQGIQGILSIENGGSWTANGDVYVGYGGTSNSQLRISAGSTFAGKRLAIHYGGGTGTTGNLAGLVENRSGTAWCRQTATARSVTWISGSCRT